MAANGFDSIQLAQHTLRIADPEVSLHFYRSQLGMTLLAQKDDGDATHYFLGFVEPGMDVDAIESDPTQWQPRCFLELVHNANSPAADIRQQPDSGEGYWKFALSVAELDVAHNRLIANGVAVDTPRQVGDIAYLCHFSDPDGYCIELIQHDFLQNHRPVAEDFNYALGSRPTFSLITYRVKDADVSLHFYTELLGMRLLSVQKVEARGFTLYFLACTDERPPHSDVEHVGNREWLWQRPYSMVELQHVWGTEEQERFAYRCGPESGFEGVSFATRNFAAYLELARKWDKRVEIREQDPILQTNTATVLDPDGYSIRLIEKARVS